MKFVPIVLWHGLLDSIDNMNWIANITPNVIVIQESRLQSIYGNIHDQINQACIQLQRENVTSYDALGFSQGGVFLRAMGLQCKQELRTLMTFGAPHEGTRVTFIPKEILYSQYVLSHIIPANVVKLGSEFYKSTSLLNQILSSPKMNIQRLVLIMFLKDKVIVPRESALMWDDGLQINETNYFKQNKDLQNLVKKNQVFFEYLDTEHMQFEKSDLLKLINKYFYSS